MTKIERINRVLAVFSISRSGHHAIIDWIYDSVLPNKAFINDPDFENPLGSRRTFYVNANKYVNRESFITHYGGAPGRRELAELRMLDLLNNGWAIEPKKCESGLVLIKTLIVNFENYDLNGSHENLFACLDTICENVNERIAIIIIRNPFNLLASRILHGGPITNLERRSNVLDFEGVLNLWRGYAEKVINAGKVNGFDKTIIIKYDEWMRSPLIKRRLGSDLELEKVRLHWNDVPIYGGGSSFDKYRYMGRGEMMKTLDRWRQLAFSDLDTHLSKRVQFGELFRNNVDIRSLSAQIFGDTDGIGQLFNE